MDSSKTVWKGFHTMQRSNSSWQDVTEILLHVHMCSASSLPCPPSSFHPPPHSQQIPPLGKPSIKFTPSIPMHILLSLTRTLEMAIFMNFSQSSQHEIYHISIGWVKQSQTENFVFAMVSPYGPLCQEDCPQVEAVHKHRSGSESSRTCGRGVLSWGGYEVGKKQRDWGSSFVSITFAKGIIKIIL